MLCFCCCCSYCVCVCVYVCAENSWLGGNSFIHLIITSLSIRYVCFQLNCSTLQFESFRFLPFFKNGKYLFTWWNCTKIGMYYFINMFSSTRKMDATFQSCYASISFSHLFILCIYVVVVRGKISCTHLLEAYLKDIKLNVTLCQRRFSLWITVVAFKTEIYKKNSLVRECCVCVLVLLKAKIFVWSQIETSFAFISVWTTKDLFSLINLLSALFINNKSIHGKRKLGFTFFCVSLYLFVTPFPYHNINNNNNNNNELFIFVHQMRNIISDN